MLAPPKSEGNDATGPLELPLRWQQFLVYEHDRSDGVPADQLRTGRRLDEEGIQIGGADDHLGEFVAVGAPQMNRDTARNERVDKRARV